MLDKRKLTSGFQAMNAASLSERGFTLLEVLLAFFIFAIIFVTIYSSYSTTFKTINLTESRMELYRKAAIALEKISEDLGSTYMSILPQGSFGQPAEYTRFLGEENDLNGHEADTLQFFSRIEPLFAGEVRAASGQLISYNVIEGTEEDELVLMRTERSEFMEEIDDRGGLVLSDGLQAFNLVYFDDQNNSHEQWDSDGEEFRGRLPSRVAVELEYLNPENPEAPFKIMTSVDLPGN